MSNKLTDLEAARLEGKDRRKYFQGYKYAGKNEVKDFSLMGKYGQATAGDHVKRAINFIPGTGLLPSRWGMQGSGAFGENVLNALGVTTRHQKNSWLARTLIPASAGYFAYDAVDTGDYAGFAGFAGAEIGFLTAFRPAKELGHAFAKGALRMGGKSSWLFGAGLGLGVGVAAGIAVGGAAYGASLLGSNDNIIQKRAWDLNKPLFNTQGMQTQNTLSARQRALNKLSKSGMNDRGAMLGSEAMLMRGML